MNIHNKRYFAIISSGILLAPLFYVLGGMLNRPVWFDEAITIVDFLTFPPDISGIYHTYPIPNNHIFYTILLRLWMEFLSLFIPVHVPSLRLFSLLTASLSVLALFFLLKKRCGVSASFCLALCAAVSLPFALYGSAVRGYMLSFLLITLATECALRYQEGGLKRYLSLHFAVSAAAVGVIPTNIVPLIAGIILAIPSFAWKDVSSRKILFLAASPPAAFLLFYLPIFGKLLKVLAIREGWGGGWHYAALHLYSAFAIAFLPFLAAVLPRLRSEAPVGGDGARRTRLVKALLLFSIPAVVMALKYPSPFPRTFFPLWPVWIYFMAIECGGALDSVLSQLREKTAVLVKIYPSAILLWGFAQHENSGRFSNLLARRGQDDFFKPYFLSETFRPHDVAQRLIELTDKTPGKVFIDNGMDYPSIIFYGKYSGHVSWLFDPPYRKIESFGDAKRIYIVAGSESRMKEIAVRFNLKSYSSAENHGFCGIYVAEQ